MSYPDVIMDRMSGWHPMLLLVEEEPGMWSMKDGAELHPFGGIAIRRTEAGIRYKVALGNEVIGWATSLRVIRTALARLPRTGQGPESGATEPVAYTTFNVNARLHSTHR